MSRFNVALLQILPTGSQEGNLLKGTGLLTQEEKAVYHEIDQVWFQENLPNPPFYNDDKPGKPITWFKTAAAGFMIEKLRPLMDMLKKYAKPYDIVYTNSPGRVVYEDEWQVAVFSDEGPGQISPLSIEHLPVYAEVIRQSFATVAKDFNLTKENCPTHTSFITDERLKGKIMDGYYPFGYFTNGKLVGFVSLTDIGGCVYELNNLAVLPEARHFGYGKAYNQTSVGGRHRDVGKGRRVFDRLLRALLSEYG